jgi:hypothetical protein
MRRSGLVLDDRSADESLDGKSRCVPVVQGDPGLVVRVEQLGGNSADVSVVVVIRNTGPGS